MEPTPPCEVILKLIKLLPLIIVLGACATMEATTTTLAPEPAIKARASQITTDAGVVELEDGVYVGYLRWVTGEGLTGGREVQFDLAAWFSGDEADAAASEDNTDAAPAGYYIRNLDPSELVLPVADEVTVTSVWYRHDGERIEESPISFEELAGVWENPSANNDLMARLRNSPWWIEIVDGRVVAFGEQLHP